MDSKDLLYAFRSRKAAETILRILVRIGNVGGREALTVEKTQYEEGNTQWFLLYWSRSYYYAFKVAQAKKKGKECDELDPKDKNNRLHYDDKAAWLSGLTQGLAFKRTR